MLGGLAVTSVPHPPSVPRVSAVPGSAPGPARCPYMVGSTERARERKGGLSGAPTAPGAPELPQLLRWISADKEGAQQSRNSALWRMQSPECRCSAPPEPVLIPMQAPSQPSPAVPGHRDPPDPARAFAPLCAPLSRVWHARSGLSDAPAAPGPFPALPLASRSHCTHRGGASSIPRTRLVHHNKAAIPALPPLHDLPFQQRSVYPNTGGFHPPLLQLPGQTNPLVCRFRVITSS